MPPDSDDAADSAQHTPAADDPRETERQPANERRPAPSPDAGQPIVAVTVIRSGGFAGLPRTWRAEAGEDDAPHWVTLIEECPWDAVHRGRRPAGADLFVWRLDARCGERTREAELSDPDVQGPWRTLIDAVREAGSSRRRGSD